MQSTTTPLLIGIALLLIDSALELSWVSNMVHWLHAYLGGQFQVLGPDGVPISLHGKPTNLLVDQGHTSNAAAGTALIVVSLGGLLVLYLRSRQRFRSGISNAPAHGFVKFLYFFWLTFTVLSTLLAFSALIFVMVVTYQHAGQHIDLELASTLNNHPYPNYAAYPDLAWTPQNWCSALLELPIVGQSVRNEIAFQLRLMHGWQWNLIPLVILDLVVCGLAFRDFAAQRKNSRGSVMMADEEMFERVYERQVKF